MKEIPVSDAPTTTILVLFSVFMVLRFFLVIIEREKGAYSSSKAFRLLSTTFLFFKFLSRSYCWKEKFHFF